MTPCLSRSLFSRRSTITIGRPHSAIASAADSAQPLARDFLLMHADAHIGRHRDVHHLRVRQFQVVHQSAYSSIDLTLSRGLNCFSSPMVETVSPL
jgi:hypothetical protein